MARGGINFCPGVLFDAFYVFRLSAGGIVIWRMFTLVAAKWHLTSRIVAVVKVKIGALVRRDEAVRRACRYVCS